MGELEYLKSSGLHMEDYLKEHHNVLPILGLDVIVSGTHITSLASRGFSVKISDVHLLSASTTCAGVACVYLPHLLETWFLAGSIDEFNLLSTSSTIEK